MHKVKIFAGSLLALALGAVTPLAPIYADGPSATQPAAVTALLSQGKALALIEVTAMKEQDGRPADGNLVEIVSFKSLKSSGALPTEINIIKAFGGMRPGPPPVPKGPLAPNPLKVGQRYWIIFNDSDWEKYQQGVVAWWPETGAPTEALNAAITADKFKKPAP